MTHVHLQFPFPNRRFLLHNGPILEGTKKGKSKFVLFGNWRTGSRLLQELLNCHPAIHCAGEVFNPTRITQKILFPCLFLEERFRASHAQLYGVSLKPDQVRKVLMHRFYDPKLLLHKLHRKGWKFIHLKRRNVLRQALSVVIALQKKHWHSRGESLEAQGKIRIDCNQLLQFIRLTEMFSFLGDELLQNIPHTNVFYEEDLLQPGCHQPTTDRVFDFLSLPPVTVKSELVRLSSDDMSAYVENYSELVEAVWPTKFGKILEN